MRAGGLVSSSAAALALALVVGGCSPSVHVHGYSPRADELERVAVGADTRESVQQKLGLPSTSGSFDDSDWYYISIKSETTAFFAPEVVEQQVVLVSFDANGVVSEVGRYGLEDGQVIDLVSRTTPTSGRKLTLIQQIFQNVGRFGGSNVINKLPGGAGGVGAPGG